MKHSDPRFQTTVSAPEFFLGETEKISGVGGDPRRLAGGPGERAVDLG